MSSPQDPLDDSGSPELRRLFAERRRRDEAVSSVYRRPVPGPASDPRARRFSAPPAWPAIAGAVAVAVLLVLAVARTRQGTGSRSAVAPPEENAQGPTLSAWSPPTDFLLTFPGGSLLDSTPILFDPDLPALPKGS